MIVLLIKPYVLPRSRCRCLYRLYSRRTECNSKLEILVNRGSIERAFGNKVHSVIKRNNAEPSPDKMKCAEKPLSDIAFK